MTYSATRDKEQLRYLDVDIAHFIQRYQSRPPGTKRRTLFLFPGGMGSQLLRARTAYQTSGSPNQTFQYTPVWLTPLTFLGDALNLKMHEVSGVYQDLADRIIIPSGTIEFLGITPYSRFVAWCELNDIDWFIFGWDWRRRLEDTVDFFLNKFLPRFKSLVQPKCGDVLQDYVLIGHSFGGMVVTLMLHQYNALLSTMGRAITVASPFYGYDGQIHRWFEGESLLNQIGPINIKPQIVKVIASLPGVYVLPYLDYSTTFQSNETALNNDPDYPLNAYPSHDFANGTMVVDPFNPGTHRYPQNIGFNTNELQHALSIYRKVAAGPDAQYTNRFFNIRGIQTSPKTTPGSVSWGLLTGPNNPNASPIGTGPGVPGDGTLPAWSTRLVTLPTNQVIPVEGDIEHMFMMEEDVTHQAIAQALQ
jgi:pimeloyl-ACP methyl ester carboxylesterase